LRSRSKERMTTFLSELVFSCAFSRGSWESASLRIFTSMACSSPGFHLNSNERVSADSLSDTATYVLVPGVKTRSFAAGTTPAAGVGEGCGVACGSGFSGERRRNTGRSASSGAPAVVLPAEDWPESAGEGVDVAVASLRWITGRSSPVVTGGGVGAFLASASCHLPSPIQPLLLALLRMVA